MLAAGEKRSEEAEMATATPTQSELNQIANGSHPTLAADGSGPDPRMATWCCTPLSFTGNGTPVGVIRANSTYAPISGPY
jgi:hypothetical protein